MSLTKQFEVSLERFHLPEFKKEWGAIQRGLEKESLRVSASGQLSQLNHPQGLGSPLTNPYITTDFSEALLEFITPPSAEVATCLHTLSAIHRFCYKNLEEDELLWVCSMPCPLTDDEDIPIARYGSSNIGKLKTLYRQGLSYRYGRRMQVIAGIHYNFSMPESFWPAFQQIRGDRQSVQDFRTSSYLHLIRNFQRYSWILLYLFGASPIAHKSLVKDKQHALQEYDAQSLYLPNATCLRMGGLGYRSEAQRSLFVCYNELNSYISSLNQALRTPYEAYEKIGVRGPDGEYRQINTNLLQLENEFYNSIRPKRVVKRGERPITALSRDGIEYVEVRLVDLNPFLPLGIDEEQIHFLDAFLLYCLLEESPPCEEKEFFEISKNIDAVVNNGRDPTLQLLQNGQQVSMRVQADKLLTSLENSALLLDETQQTNLHLASVRRQREKIHHPELTPSGQMLETMSSMKQSFSDFAMFMSQKQQHYFRADKSEPGLMNTIATASAASPLAQKEIEQADKIDFDTFLRKWNAF